MTRWLLACFAIFAFVASAADISGTWKGSVETPNGSSERTFVFKVDGSKVTGETTSSMLGKSEINNGKVEGDDLSFTITVKFQDNEMQLDYKGKVSGDQIKFVVEANGQQVAEYAVKKVS